jgi:hypothetical protein
MKTIDINAMPDDEVRKLSVELGTKMRDLIDNAIEMYKEKTGEQLRFTHKIAQKLRLVKNKEDSDIAKLENEVNKELNKIVNPFGIKTQLTLSKE